MVKEEGESNGSEELAFCPRWADPGCIWDSILEYSPHKCSVFSGDQETLKRLGSGGCGDQVLWETDHKMAPGMEQRGAFFFFFPITCFTKQISPVEISLPSLWTARPVWSFCICSTCKLIPSSWGPSKQLALSDAVAGWFSPSSQGWPAGIALIFLEYSSICEGSGLPQMGGQMLA